MKSLLTITFYNFSRVLEFSPQIMPSLSTARAFNANALKQISPKALIMGGIDICLDG